MCLIYDKCQLWEARSRLSMESTLPTMAQITDNVLWEDDEEAPLQEEGKAKDVEQRRLNHNTHCERWWCRYNMDFLKLLSLCTPKGHLHCSPWGLGRCDQCQHWWTGTLGSTQWFMIVTLTGTRFYTVICDHLVYIRRFSENIKSHFTWLNIVVFKSTRKVSSRQGCS